MQHLIVGEVIYVRSLSIGAISVKLFYILYYAYIKSPFFYFRS